MRKGFGIGLSVLGGFLVILGLLAQFWVPGQLMKTPLNVDNTTLLDGTAQLSNGKTMDSFPVRVFSVTRTDSERSDDEVVVWENSTCLVKDEGGIDECVSASDPEERLISATTDNFASDRVTGVAVDDPKYLPPSAERKEGLVNKWPFEAEKKSYLYWDGTAGEAVEANYDRTETIDGLEMYVYTISISDVPVEITDGLSGTYSTEKEAWVEPMTGSIVNQFEHQEQIDDEGNPFIILDLAFTDDFLKTSVEETKSQAGSLKLISSTVPLVAFIVGIPALLIGLALQIMSRRREKNDTYTKPA